MIAALMLAAAVASPSPSPAASQAVAPIASPAPAPIVALPAVSAYAVLPTGWTVNANASLLTPTTRMRFLAIKQYLGGVESLNLVETHPPKAITLAQSVSEAKLGLPKMIRSFHLTISRPQIICNGTLDGWQLSYSAKYDDLSFEMIQVVGISSSGDQNVFTYTRPNPSPRDPAAMASLGTLCPQNFVIPPSAPTAGMLPGLSAPLPIGWASASGGAGIIPGSDVIGTASTTLPSGGNEAYSVTAVSMRKFGVLTNEPLDLHTVGDVAGEMVAKEFAGGKLISSNAVQGCGGTEPQWQVVVQNAYAIILERVAQSPGRLVFAAYARPITMSAVDPAAQRALDAFCLAPKVAFAARPERR